MRKILQGESLLLLLLLLVFPSVFLLSSSFSPLLFSSFFTLFSSCLSSSFSPFTPLAERGKSPLCCGS